MTSNDLCGARDHFLPVITGYQNFGLRLVTENCGLRMITGYQRVLHRRVTGYQRVLKNKKFSGNRVTAPADPLS